MNNILILGGSGFIGRSVTAQLIKAGAAVRVLTRSAEKARSLATTVGLTLVQGDPHVPAELARAMVGQSVVINLIGVLHDRPKGEFERAHVALPQAVLAAAELAGIRRVIHMSALGASETGPSAYLRSRGKGEALARAASSAPAPTLDVTVLRPSVVYGEGDGLTMLFAQLVRLFPLLPLGGAHARFQPVWVEDVARALVESIAPAHIGKVYDLGGPHVHSLRDILTLVIALSGKSRSIVPLPHSLAYLQALVLEFAPGGPLMTRDNLASMAVDNVTSQPWPFDWAPASMASTVPTYLGNHSGMSRGRYSYFHEKSPRKGPLK